MAAVGVSSNARKEGYVRLSLEVMHENDRAKALYERLGFLTQSYHSLAWLKNTTGYSGSYLMKQEL